MNLESRKKILSRDNYKCTRCNSTKHLVVHHTFYSKNDFKAWEYPDKSLITLCSNCHRLEHFPDPSTHLIYAISISELELKNNK